MISEQEVNDRLRYELAALEHLSVDDIADVLRQEKIKGRPTASCLCPMAMYLSRRVGDTISVGTSECGLMRVRAFEFPSGVSMPESVRQFIFEFDAGHFLDLRVEA